MSAGLIHERKARKAGFRFIVGIDEAGRGPLAGPVVAAAVSLKSWTFDSRVDDSKKITPRQRLRAFHEIHEKGHIGIGIVSEAVIDRNNIAEATRFAMSTALSNLILALPDDERERENFSRKTLLLVDGRSFDDKSPYPYQAIIGGDGISLSIACASIIAKVTRDRILETYDKIYPGYGFKNHKGYGTAAHKKALKRLGPSLIHRKTYRW